MNTVGRRGTRAATTTGLLEARTALGPSDRQQRGKRGAGGHARYLLEKVNDDERRTTNKKQVNNNDGDEKKSGKKAYPSPSRVVQDTRDGSADQRAGETQLAARSRKLRHAVLATAAFGAAITASVPLPCCVLVDCVGGECVLCGLGRLVCTV